VNSTYRRGIDLLLRLRSPSSHPFAAAVFCSVVPETEHVDEVRHLDVLRRLPVAARQERARMRAPVSQQSDCDWLPRSCRTSVRYESASGASCTWYHSAGSHRLVALGALILALLAWLPTAAAQTSSDEPRQRVRLRHDAAKTSGCDGCDDGGAQSSSKYDSPGGYVEFTSRNEYVLDRRLEQRQQRAIVWGHRLRLQIQRPGGADVLQERLLQRR